MTKDQLMKRLVRKSGSPLQKKVTPIKMMRRDENHVILERDDSNDYDDFFDFEKELSDTELVSSRKLAASAPGAESFIKENQETKEIKEEKPSGPSFMVMRREEPEEKKEPVSSFFVLEAEPEKEPEEEAFQFEDENSERVNESADHTNETSNDESSSKTYKDVVGFKFVQCNFIKSDGDRCKRQAPKGHEICSVHQKVLKKRQSD